MNENSEVFWKEFLSSLDEDQKRLSPKVSAAYAGTSETTDGLIALYQAGKKAAGSSLVDDFKTCGDELPKVNDYWIVLDRNSLPKFIAKTVRIEIHKFKDVPQHVATAEGEGDASLEYWRKVHRKIYTPDLPRWGIADLDEAEVITEYFEIVFPKNWAKKTIGSQPLGQLPIKS